MFPLLPKQPFQVLYIPVFAVRPDGHCTFSSLGQAPLNPTEAKASLLFFPAVEGLSTGMNRDSSTNAPKKAEHDQGTFNALTEIPKQAAHWRFWRFLGEGCILKRESCWGRHWRLGSHKPMLWKEIHIGANALQPRHAMLNLPWPQSTTLQLWHINAGLLCASYSFIGAAEVAKKGTDSPPALTPH